MHPSYIAALETRLRWLEWAKHGPGAGATWEQKGYHASAMPQFIALLEEGETFYMDPHFGSLVEHAAASMPDTVRFELDWMVRPSGWLYLGAPLAVPLPVGAPMEDLAGKTTALVGAVGWRYIPAGANVRQGMHGPYLPTEVPGTHFMCFLDFQRMGFVKAAGFGAWSFFLLKDGQTLGERIRTFEARVAQEDPGSNYASYAGPEYGEARRHEMRWVYAAMHLMAQRLSVRVRHDTDRATRRRLDAPQRPAPPFITVVTLRRLEAARPKQPSEARDWHWQWEVRGHWRNQWYAAEGIHKPKFIEAYVKGPADKPFKEAGTKLFVARR